MGAENRIEDTGEEETASLGRCFNALFSIPFGPGALLNLISLMAS